MGKSVEELKRILERMQKDLASPSSSTIEKASEPPIRVAKLPVPSIIPPRPAPARAAEVSRIRGIEDEGKVFDQEAIGAVWKSPRALLWGATVLALAGVALKNLWVLALAFLGLLVYALLWSAGNGRLSAEDMEDLSLRVAVLEKRLAARGISSGGGGISPQAAEEIEELRVMVRSMYRVLQESSTTQETATRREHEEDE